MSALVWRVVGVALAFASVAVLTSAFLASPARAQTPEITSITVADITMTTATVTVNLSDVDDGTRVYLKYGPVNSYLTNPKPPAYNVGNESGQDRWFYVYSDADPLSSNANSGAATFNLPDSALPGSRLANGVQPLWASYQVNVEASLDSTFGSGVVSQTFTTLPPRASGAWVDAGQTELGIQTWLSTLSGVPYTLYYRWRAEGATTWNTGSRVVPWGNAETSPSQVKTRLVSHTPYVMQVSLDPNFPEDETQTQTAWTYEPEVVRIGVRKVTETEATVTAIMDHPNGKEYGLGCQYHLNSTYWSQVLNEHPIVGHVGATLLDSLTSDSAYDYRCRLSFDHGQFEGVDHSRSSDARSTHTQDGTSTALTEIRGTLSGRSATITVDLVNTDGTNNDVYLRHREYPSTEWIQGATRATVASTAQWTSTLTDDTVHEFEASLDAAFPDAGTLTLYLTVGDPPYATIGNYRPPQPTTPQTPQDTTNNDGGTQDTNDNNGGTQDPNNNGGTQTQTPVNNGGGGGGFGGGGVVQRNTAPDFRDSAGRMRSIPENSAEDVEVGDPILAWDPENDPLEFTLRGADSAPFKIKKLNDHSAQLLVGPNAVLDYEAQSVHLVTVVATDSGGEERVLVIEVQLTDVKLPGRADEFDVANNHDEHLDREEVEAASAALGLNLLTLAEMAFVLEYYYETNFAAIDFANFVPMVAKYDLNADSVIDRDEVLSAFTEFQAGNISKEVMQQILKTHFTTSMVDVQDPPVESPPAEAPSTW